MTTRRVIVASGCVKTWTVVSAVRTIVFQEELDATSSIVGGQLILRVDGEAIVIWDEGCR